MTSGDVVLRVVVAALETCRAILVAEGGWEELDELEVKLESGGWMKNDKEGS